MAYSDASEIKGPDPDTFLDLLYACGSNLNWDGYCNPEIDKLIEQQSIEGDPGRRKQLLWAIERKLAEEGARPIIFYSRAGTCWQPWVKGLTIMVDSVFTAGAGKTSGSINRTRRGLQCNQRKGRQRKWHSNFAPWQRQVRS